MGLREELAGELESARLGFHHVLDSVPEALYSHPSDNPAWTVGDVLYHITLGPSALCLEIMDDPSRAQVVPIGNEHHYIQGFQPG